MSPQLHLNVKGNHSGRPFTVQGGGPTWTLFIRHCVFILTCGHATHLQSVEPFHATHLSGLVSHSWKQLLRLLTSMPFSASAVFVCLFVSPLPHRQNVSLGGIFSSGETKQKKMLLTAKLCDEGGWGTGVMPILV